MMMDLQLRVHLLLVLLLVSSSALTPEQCEPLIQPRSMSDPAVLLGRINLLAGYTDNEIFKSILKLTYSSWLNITEGENGGVEVTEEDNMNGTCIGASTNVTIEGNTVKGLFSNIQTWFHILPSCEDCLVFRVNSSSNDISKILEIFKIEKQSSTQEFKAHSVYLLGRNSTVENSDLERFRKQANCLGFQGEPDWIYDPEKGFCKEGEGVRFPN